MALRDVVIATAVMVVPCAAVAGTPVVQYEAHRLTIQSERAPLGDVLDAVARATGIEIVGEPLDAREVSIRIVDVPLLEALDRLIGSQNFVVRYGADGEPERLELLGGPEKPPAPKRPASERGLRALELLVGHPAVAVPPAAAEALGGDSLPPDRLLPGLRHANPLVRRESVEVLVHAIEGRKETLDAICALEVEQLTRFFEVQSGEHVDEVMVAFYRNASDPTFKRRLELVLARRRSRS
jgi:hypothetical protein